MKTLVIVPAFNEEANIERTVKTLTDTFKSDAFDYIIINDGSTDKTEGICKKNSFNYISHPVNLGLKSAVQTGFLFAYQHGYDAAIQFDGDGQHDPSFIEAMAEQIALGHDIVIGSRFVSEKKPFSLRMIGSFLIGATIFITTGKRIKDPTSGMRMYNKATIKKLAHANDLGPEPDTVALLLRKGATVKEIQVKMFDRTAGKSYLTFWKSVNYMAKMLVSILILQWFRKG